MAENNETSQVMKILERIQARMDESKNKMELVATLLQTLVNDTQRKIMTSLKLKKFSKYEEKIMINKGEKMIRRK